jgi:hypothetical protein
MAGSTPSTSTLNLGVGHEKVHERVHLLSRVMDAAKGRRIVLIVDEVGFDHRLVIETVSEPGAGSSEQCEANR